MADLGAGAGSKEYRAIQHNCKEILDTLGKTVDPALFARRLLEQSLINEGRFRIYSAEIACSIAPTKNANSFAFRRGDTTSNRPANV